MRGRWTASLVAASIVLGSLSACSSSSPHAARHARVASVTTSVMHPNIVVVLADDLDASSFFSASKYSAFHDFMVTRGMTFPNFFVSDSLCCPSRATILRGQYVHSTGVEGNNPPYGGFERFHALGRESSTLATWLHDAGYTTGLFGKYLNNYPRTAGEHYIPPGWDRWVSPVGGNPYAEYNYKLSVDGRVEHHKQAPRDYLVDALARHAVDFIQHQTPLHPFFAFITPFVPHAPATPAPRHARAFLNLTAPRTASFDQRDVSAEPAWLRKRPQLSSVSMRYLDHLYRRRLQSMLGVDDMLRSIFATLTHTGRLHNTYVIFTSDNGFHLGQHRLPAGKQTPFEEDIRVPLVVRGPGVRAGAVSDVMARTVDLAPTIAALAHARVPSFVEGESLTPALNGTRFANPPRDALIEHFESDGGSNEPLVPRSAWKDGLPPEPRSPDDDQHPPVAGAPTSGDDAAVIPTYSPPVDIPTYRALRTTRYLYVEYSTGELQLYDLRVDPAELRNLADTASPALILDLSNRLHALERCQAATCRTA